VITPSVSDFSTPLVIIPLDTVGLASRQGKASCVRLALNLSCLNRKPAWSRLCSLLSFSLSPDTFSFFLEKPCCYQRPLVLDICTYIPVDVLLSASRFSSTLFSERTLLSLIYISFTPILWGCEEKRVIPSTRPLFSLLGGLYVTLLVKISAHKHDVLLPP